MSLNLINKKFNIKQNEYLLDCDLVNKYNLKSLYKKPKINYCPFQNSDFTSHEKHKYELRKLSFFDAEKLQRILIQDQCLKMTNNFIIT